MKTVTQGYLPLNPLRIVWCNALFDGALLHLGQRDHHTVRSLFTDYP